MQKARLTGFAAAALLLVSVGTVANAQESSPAADNLKVAFAMYTIGTPFAQGVLAGARDAAADLGVEFTEAGVEGFEPIPLAQIVQDQISAGADAIVTPGTEQNAAVLEDWGGTYATMNLLSPTLETVYVGERSTESGRTLGQYIVEKLGGPEATGKVLIGICVAGLSVLENRAAGLIEGLSAAPGLEIIGPFATATDPSQNYPIYEQQYAANPDAVAVLGTCSTDTTSIGRLNSENDMKFVGGGWDITPETLKVIADGSVYVTLGQGAYLQGYLPVQVVVESLRTGTPVPAGFINSGTEPVTIDNWEEYQALFDDPSQLHAYYQDKIPSDITTVIEPPENESK